MWNSIAKRSKSSALPRYRPLLEMLEDRVVLANDFYHVPGVPGETVRLQFKMNGKAAGANNEMSIYLVDDVQGRVDGLLPSQVGYATAAAARAQKLFSATATVGTPRELSLPSGQSYGFLLVRRGSLAQWSQSNPENNPQQSPLLLFSVDAANPLSRDAVQTKPLTGDAYQVRWEDATSSSVRRLFNDNSFTIKPVRGSVLKMPGQTGQTVTTTFTVTSRNASFRNELGYFLVDDAIGTIDGVRPGQAGYAQKAFSSTTRQVIFGNRQRVGSVSSITLPSGSNVVFYIIQNSTSADLLQRNPNNLKNKTPLAFFSLQVANPDRYGHQQWQGFNRFGFEDLYNGGDKDFDDIVVRFTMSAPQGAAETDPPVITAGLRLDTASGGTTNNDTISSIVDVQGTIADQSQITTFQASLDQSNQFTSVLSSLSANGNFLIDRNRLNQLAGGTLVDGAHTLMLRAVDQHGNTSSIFNLPFVLDSKIALNVNLDPASDTGPVGDLITSLGTIALTGLTDPGATVKLVGSSITTTANNQGQYTLPGISLTLGANPLQVKAIDVAGNERVASITVTYEQSTDVHIFDDNLTGWRVDELGGTPTGKGFVTTSNGSATIHEGDSYLISLSREFAVLSTGSTRMDIEFTSPQFDTAAINSLRDAFEVAFLDSNGQTRVLPFALTRDAWYNATEGQGEQVAPGASASTGTIRVNLAGLPAGTTGRLFFRLFNNDGDTQSQVTLHRVSLVSDSSLTPPSGSPSASLTSTPTPLTIDPSTLTNVSGSLVGQYGRSSYFAGNTVLYTTLALRNIGSYGIGGPAIVVIDNLSDPTVVPQGIDGFLPDGRAYFNFTGFLNNGKLAPGATTGVRPLQFFTPSAKPFTYNLTVLALPNRVPNFTTEALPDVAPGRTYVYDSEAVDPDGDILSYQLLTGPTGLSINQNTGLVSWTPTMQQVGNHDVILEASDGCGGNTTQRFTISVRTDIPNRPPIITSTPIVDAYVNRSGDPAGREYNYDVEGFDPDFDPVSYRLAQSPEGMTIDPVTGLIQWRPTANATSTVSVYHRVDLSSFYNNRLQTFSFGNAFNFPVGDQIFGGVPFNIPANGNNTWIAGSPASIDVPVNVYGVTEVDTLINTIWGEFDPATFASVEFYGSDGAFYRYDLDGNRDVRDYVQNVFTNTITGPIATNVFKTGSGFLNEVRLDMQKFTLPATFANQTLTHVKFTDTGHDFFQRIVLTGMAVVASVPLMGDHPITVVAEDGRGGSAEQNFTVSVRNPPENNEPLFVSVPPNLTSPQPSHAVFVDTFNNEPVAPGVFSYTNFANWDVTAGAVDIVDVNTPSGALSFPPLIDGWAVDLISAGNQGLGRIQTKNIISLEPGTYDLTFTLGGSHRSFSPSDSARISLGSAFSEDFTLGFDSPMTKYTRTVVISQPITARFVVEATSNAGNDNAGILIDDISMVQRAVPPKSGVIIGQTYTYDSLAIDPDDDELQYTIVSGPAGLTVNADTGVVTWNTTGFVEGAYEVFLKVADGRGGETVQNFAIQLYNQGGTIRGRKFDTTSQAVYTNNFEAAGPLPEWSDGTRSITPSGRNFLGEFGDQTVSLTLPSQPAGTSITVAFDLYIIRTWDGNNTTFGPDSWQLAVQGGPTLTRTTFSNHTDPQFGNLFDQSYPAQFTNPVTHNPAKSGADERDTLGYGTGFQGDSVYHLSYTFDHPGGPLTLNFTGDTDSPVGNESWGLDNVIVSYSPNTGLAGFIVYLDQNNNAARDPGESYQITDSQGNYEFTNLPPGQYVVREEVVPIGSQSYLYSDGDFSPTNWNDATVFLRDANPSLSGPTVLGPTLRTTGGNTGNYRYQGDDFRVGDLIATSHINNTAVYDPHVQGAIESIDFAIDLIQFPPTLPGQNPGGTAFTLALMQNGNVYFATPFSNSQTTWQHRTFEGITADQFDTAIIPEERLGNHPDFSSNGAPITFGYGHFIAGGGSSGFRILNEWGIDNWEVTVNNVGQTGLWEQTFPVENTTGQSPANYVDWIEANVPGGTASGIITLPDGSTVGLDFAAINPDGTLGNLFSAQTNGTGTNYWIPSEPYISPEVPNAPPGTDILALQGGVNQTYRISFTEPIVDPVMSILSLGKPNFPIDYVFDAPFTILSQGAGWWGGGENDLVQLPGNILRGTEGHGTIQFIGTFSSFSWTVPTFEQWHGFTFAIRTVERLASDGFYNVDLSAGEIEPDKDFGNSRKADAGPSFTTEPVRTATVNDLYRYNVEAVGSGGVTYDLPQKPVGMAIDPNTGLIVWRPQDVQEGFQTVVVRVRDGQGRVAIQSYTIEVQQGNTAPAFTTEPTRQAVVGRPWQYRASGVDAENDTLTFTLDSGPAGLTITPQGIVNWTPAGNQLGSQLVQIKVSDGRGGEAIQLFTLNVVTSAPNTNPVITGTPRTSVRVGDQYLAQLSASDADGDPLTYSLPTSPNGMTINNDGRLHFSPTAAQLGAHQVTVRVVDGQGGSAETTFTLSVVGQETNSTPEITSTPPSAATLGRTLRYTPTFSDADGDPVVWSLLSGPVGMAIDPETGIIRWRPTQSQLGPQTVVLQVTDPMLASTPQNFTITVRGSNTPPAILSSPITEAAVSQSYEYRVRAQDAEGDVLTYALPIAPSGMVIDSNTGIITWNPGVAQVGSFSVQVSASDGQGGVATQDFNIVVSGTALNRPPIITSPPILKASINRVYSYQIVASDPEGDALVYALLSGPVGMTIDPATGLVNWTPTTAQLGSHLVTVGARDASGIFGQQAYRISVIDNQAPTITSSPVTHGTPGTLYRYDVGATDLDGDTLAYALTQFQPGMTIDQSGRISWNVPLAQGTVPIGISVTDGRGGIAVQNFNLTIAGDTQAPQVTASINPNPATIGSDILIRVTASDNDRVASLVLRINGVVIPLAADGTAHYEALGEGNLPVQVIATDPSGNQGVYTTNIVITDEADPTGQGPAILITSPSDTSNITSLANIVGSINSADGVSSWSVHLAPYGSSSFRQIASGTGAVSNGILGTLDPTLLANDQYIVRVIARDSLNRSSRADVTVNIQGELKLGRFRQEFTDLSIPLAGIPIEIRRVYDSLNAGQQGDFGYGWTMAFADPQIRETVSQNAGYGYFGPEAAPFKVGTKVYLTTPDGERVGFTLAMDTIVVPFFGTYYRPRFVGDAGVVEKLDVLTQPDNGLGDLYIKLADGTFSQPFAVFGGRFNPDNYNLTLTNGTIYRYNQQTGLKEVVDTNGNKLTFSPDGVTSSLGVSIQFLRDAQGRIAEIIDPSGKSFKYAYDGNGNLSTVMDQINNKTQFQYSTTHEHYLSKLIDPRGNTVLQMQYDPVTGRATGLVDAQGNSLHSTFDPGDNSEAVRDRRGNTTKYFYDERGNVERVIDPEGGVTTNVYDNSNNLISRTDPNNHTTIFRYDAQGNRTSMTDALNGVTTYEYNAQNKVIRVTDALGRITTSEYSSTGLKIRELDAAGILTTFEYDDQGRLIALTNAACCGGTAILYAYDSALNRVTQVTDTSGHVTQFEYNSYGLPTLTRDENNEVTRYVYSGTGRLLKVIDANLGITEYTYDANGNLLTTTDPLLQQTRFEYDTSNRIISSTDASGKTTSYEFDENNNQIETTDRNGRTRRFVYDRNNRMTEEQWLATGNTVVRTIAYQYDPAGNRVSIDDLDSHYTFTYDSLNRVISEDNLGTPLVPHVVFTMNYDAAGQLLSVQDSQGIETQYTYDIRGLVTSRTWTGPGIDSVRVDYGYNALRQQTTISRYSDLAGTQLISRTQRSYNDDGELTQITERSAADVIFARYDYSFTPNGQVATTTENGQLTQYTYDSVGQLLSANHVSQTDELYSYDAAGNRISSQRHGSQYNLTTGNRLTTDGAFDYSYDDEGNLIQRTHRSTGESTQFTYDYRNRLTSAERRSAGGQLLEQSLFTYDARNRRIIVQTSAGITHTLYYEDNPWADYSSNGNVQVRYLTGRSADDMIARSKAGSSTQWYLTDRQGSVRDILSHQGIVVNHNTFDSFGNLVSQSNAGESDRFLFTGREYDPSTKLYHYRARQYDASTGRFQQEDPLGFRSDDANLYRYVGNDPISGRDPYGLNNFAENGFLRNIQSFIADIIGDAKYAEYSSKINAALKSPNTLCAALGFGTSLAGGFTLEALAQALGIPANATKDPGIAIGLAWLKSTVELLCIARIGHK